MLMHCRTEPDSGLLITFFQFLFAALAAYPTQFSISGPYTLRNPSVPISRWTVIAAMFYSINMLNNYAFAFNISVPVHIILRSFGSVTTMLAGFIRGKRYSWLQVLSVMILTMGVLVSAWADAISKVSSTSRMAQFLALD
jgi:UDP-xylose/UDP-N-acetylglucosamine transporter B4